MSTVELSKRYAKALFATSKEIGNQSDIFKQLVKIQEVLSDSLVSGFINDPNINKTFKKNALLKALEGFNFSKEILNFIELLIDKNRIFLFSNILNAFQLISDSDMGITRGTVLSAKPLNEENLKNLEIKISNVLKKKIVLTHQIDSSVIGGVVAKVGGWTFDDSLNTHLKKINEILINH